MSMSMFGKRPEWLTEPCPQWCDRDHLAQRVVDSRRHHSDYLLVPVIQRLARTPGCGRLLTDDVEADELNIVAFRDVNAQETWVAIANDRQGLQLTLESTTRLHTVLGSFLGQLTAGDNHDQPA